MNCQASTRSGRQCRRSAAAGASVCTRHSRAAEVQAERSFYGRRLDPDQIRALGDAASLEGVDAELAIMRVLVRSIISEGDVDAARRAVDTVARLVKIKHDLNATRGEQLSTSLDRVLDTLAQELGAPL